MAAADPASRPGRSAWSCASRQISGLVDLLDHGANLVTIAEPFDAWCAVHILPWVDDHLGMDAESVRRWRCVGLDLTRPLTSAAIVAAAEADPRIGSHIDGYLSMSQPPSSLALAEPLARSVYESGWRPPTGQGPARSELIDLARAVGHPTADRVAEVGRRNLAAPPS